ncbi:hypothetical protein SAMN05216276_108631 [Streptosporangium subroseum]|uniref:Uncharacterized protein n=1 Tax=Streptosporangium subroseum TaxID=106412 RepID=A0A239P5D8_9ACTN|nr:hypothetical protein [Streptosporangium subroseum]SNT61963.1 hypothetical protein SAMN05216276_108631 [Streptosporangium subroseum]
MFRRRLAAVAITVALAATSAVSSTPAAATSSAALYTDISVTVTLAQCPRGARGVKRVNITITTPGTSGSNWNGDTVSGLKAFTGNNLVQGTNFCQTGTGIFGGGIGYYNTWQVYRYFSCSGQRTYV